jgi:hypothetical protein
MPARKTAATTRIEDDEHGTAEQSPDDRQCLDQNQLSRWAQLIANGEVAFPHELQPAQEEALLREVRVRRHDRLVKFVARHIAEHIAANAPSVRR